MPPDKPVSIHHTCCCKARVFPAACHVLHSKKAHSTLVPAKTATCVFAHLPITEALSTSAPCALGVEVHCHVYLSSHCVNMPACVLPIYCRPFSSGGLSNNSTDTGIAPPAHLPSTPSQQSSASSTPAAWPSTPLQATTARKEPPKVWAGGGFLVGGERGSGQQQQQQQQQQELQQQPAQLQHQKRAPVLSSYSKRSRPGSAFQTGKGAGEEGVCVRVCVLVYVVRKASVAYEVKHGTLPPLIVGKSNTFLLPKNN